LRRVPLDGARRQAEKRARDHCSMRTARRTAASSGAVLILTFMQRFFLIATLAALSAGAALAQIGRRAPGFSLHDLKWVQHDLQDYRGKILVLEFIKTDCPHCGVFARLLEEIKASYGGKVAVLAFVLPPDEQGAVERFAAQAKVTYPILFDCGQAAYSYILPDPLSGGAITFPHAYLIDSSGIIRGDWVFGPQTKDIFEGRGLNVAIDKLLAGKPQ